MAWWWQLSIQPMLIIFVLWRDFDLKHTSRWQISFVKSLLFTEEKKSQWMFAWLSVITNLSSTSTTHIADRFYFHYECLFSHFDLTISLQLHFTKAKDFLSNFFIFKQHRSHNEIWLLETFFYTHNHNIFYTAELFTAAIFLKRQSQTKQSK